MDRHLLWLGIYIVRCSQTATAPSASFNFLGHLQVETLTGYATTLISMFCEETEKLGARARS